MERYKYEGQGHKFFYSQMSFFDDKQADVIDVYRQVIGTPMDTNCAPLVANLFLFSYESDFMMSFSDDE